MTRALALLAALALVSPADASPRKAPHKTPHKKTHVPHATLQRLKSRRTATTSAHRHDSAHARVAFGQAGVLRPAREIVGRHEGPLTPEEETAKQLEKLLRGPLRRGITGLFVADAHTGEPLFAVNAEDPLNPASNVKMISTAAALELLGPEFRYTTRLLGPAPDETGAIRGDVYLLGSWDPTLAASDMSELAEQLAARGVRQLDGDVLVGVDPTRDGIYRAIVPIEVTASAPGEPPTATAPEGFDLVTIDVKAKTSKRARRPRLTYHTETTRDAGGHVRVALTIGGTIGKGRHTTHLLVTKERTADAAHALRAALRAHQIAVHGDVRSEELGDFVGDSVTAGALPVELGRHESERLADIVRRVNKRSINWLADRVIMTAAALSRHTTPSMDIALDAMYGWLARHPHLAKSDLVVDTGSGLSYRTQISPHELASVVRSAAGFTSDIDPATAKAWLRSLSISGTDGTLRRRFRKSDLRGRIHGKTGTLSTSIALSGVLDLDPQRPLVFSIVTNGDRPLAKKNVRHAHEQLLGILSRYVEQSAEAAAQAAQPAQTPPAAQPGQPAPAAQPAAQPPRTTVPARVDEPDTEGSPADDTEDAQPDPMFDAEAAGGN